MVILSDAHQTEVNNLSMEGRKTIASFSDIFWQVEDIPLMEVHKTNDYLCDDASPCDIAWQGVNIP